MRALMILICLALPAAAQEVSEPQTPPPETSASPVARPESLAGSTPSGGDMAGSAGAGSGEAETQSPASSTDAPDADAPGYVAPDNDVDVVETGPSVPDRLAEGETRLDECLADLDARGVAYEVSEPIVEEDDAACGIRNPVRVTGLAGDVALEPAGFMRCATARALAGWVSDFALPASRQLEKRGVLTAVEQGSTYICRRRNNLPEGKLSEHAYGNAVDIMAFHFAEGDPIPIQPREREGTMAEAFQDATRSTACLYFTTVLGPGSDESHADHLHLDIRERRGGFRLCQ